MAYKFQVGRTRLSGSTLFENGLDVSGSVGVETALVVPAIGVSTDKDIISLANQTVDFASDVDVDVKKAGGLQIASVAVTATAAELNYLDNDDLAASDLQKLADVTSTAAELNLLDTAAAGTAINSKAVIYSANGDIVVADDRFIGTAGDTDMLQFDGGSEINVASDLDFNIAKTSGLQLAGTAVTAVAAELNLLDLGLSSLTSGKVVANKALVVDGSRDLTGSAEGDKIRDMEVFRDFEAGRRVKADRVQAQAGGQLKAYLSGSGEISGSAALKIGGDSSLGGGLTVEGASVVFNAISADTALNVAADGLYFRDADDSTMKRVAVGSFVTDIAGDALKNDANQLQLDIDGLSAETIATGDTIVFNDDTDDGLHKVTFDNVITKSPALLTEAVIDTSDDFIMFLDGSGTGDAKKEKLVDLMNLQAGTGVSVSGGQFTVDTSGGDRISVAAIADGGTAVAGLNSFADITSNASVSLPASPTAGDIVIIKAANVQPGVTITVNRQGSHVIDGQASQVLESPFAALTCVYASGSSGNDWRII